MFKLLLSKMFLLAFVVSVFPAKAGWLDIVACTAKRIAIETNQSEEVSRETIENRIRMLLDSKNNGVAIGASFEGCVLTVRLDYSAEQQARRNVIYIEKRTNIGFLKTDYCFVDAKNQNKDQFTNAGRTTIFYEAKDDIHARLRALERTASKILDEEMERYPVNVKTRLKVIAGREERELEDKIYLDAGQGFLSKDYTWNFSPMTAFLFDAKSDKREEFMELMDTYGKRFCSDEHSG